MIKDQKLLDAYAIIESYCEVVLERIKLLEHQRLVTVPLLVNVLHLLFSFCCVDILSLLDKHEFQSQNQLDLKGETHISYKDCEDKGRQS